MEKTISRHQATWTNNLTIMGVFLTCFGAMTVVRILVPIGIVTAIFAIIRSLSVFRCPHCGAFFLGVQHLNLAPFSCEKCHQTIKFTNDKSHFSEEEVNERYDR